MKKPKDVADLASRLANAASTPLVALMPETPMPETPAKVKEAPPATAKRKAPNRSTIGIYLRLSKDLYDQCDGEAVRRTKASGRGVTVQQVILDRLTETSA